MSAPKPNNLAARMGRWSADHWKTATFGWLAFVLVAFGLGGAFGTKSIDPNTAGPGESGRMDRILDAGLQAARGRERPRPERLALGDRSGLHGRGRRRRREDLEARRRPERPVAARRGQRGPDLRERPRGARRVRDPRRSRRGRRQDRPGPRRGRRRAAGASAVLHRRVRRRQRGQGDRDGVRRRSREGRRHLAPGDARHPRGRLRGARGRRHSARARPDRRLRDLRPRGRLEPPPADGESGRRGRAPDRPRGRRRLLALLPATRARGAGRRTQRARRGRDRRRHVRSRGPRLRPDRDDGDGRHVPDRRPDLRLARRCDDHGGRRCGSRIADRAPCPPREVRGQGRPRPRAATSAACAAATGRAGSGARSSTASCVARSSR